MDLLGETFLLRDTQASVFRSNGRRVGLEASEAKTKAMLTARTPRDVDFVDIGGLLIEVVDHFKYLGSVISSNNTIDMELHTRTTSQTRLTGPFKISSVPLKCRTLPRYNYTLVSYDP